MMTTITSALLQPIYIKDARSYMFTYAEINLSIYLSICLYLFTLIIGHKSSDMLSILKKLTLQKKLQNSVTNNVFWDKK